MKTILASPNNYGTVRRTEDIKYIVVHYTANKGDTAENNAKYFKRELTKSSAHYFIDDHQIVQSVYDNVIAYAVGGTRYTGTSAPYYGKCLNKNSLSIEMCNPKKLSFSQLDKDVKRITQEFIRAKMKEYNIPLCNVIRHYDVTGKQCPLQLLPSAVWYKFLLDLVPTPTKTITKKSSKNDIAWLQISLNLRLGCSLAIDGCYGPKTQDKVLALWKVLGWNKLGINDGSRSGKKTISQLIT